MHFVVFMNENKTFLVEKLPDVIDDLPNVVVAETIDDNYTPI